MSQNPPPGQGPLAQTGEHRIDQVCTAFEQAWKSGEPVRIEDWLTRLPQAEQPRLLYELILVEVELRRATGTSPELDEYRRRFPSQPEIVGAAVDMLRESRNDAASTLIGSVSQDSSCREMAGDRMLDKPDSNRPDCKLPAIPWYSVERELGRGGMGVVYACRHEPTGQLVALKLMLRGQGAGIEELARFRVEAEALACVVWKAIQKDPPRRYANCKVLAEELWCCLDGKIPAAQESRERRDPPRDPKYDDIFLKAFPPKRG